MCARHLPLYVALIDRDTLAETLLRFGQIVDVETEGAVVEPVVGIELVPRDTLADDTHKQTILSQIIVVMTRWYGK